MAAFTAHEFTTPPDTEQLANLTSDFGKFDTNGNFNGQAGIPYNGNFTITGVNELPQGALFSALYGQAGPNTVTIQFTAPLVTVSTTTSDYTLSGPSAPSITSVVFNAGSREILLNLSGALVTTNTYTLAIKPMKVLTGSQIGYAAPKTGAYNWPNLVVDVILPATISVTGVGIAQAVDLGTPNIDTAGAAVATGISEVIVLGTPVASTLTAAVGVGIAQAIALGTPSDAPNVQAPMVGIAQPIALGVPVITQQQEPLGVGFVQSIALGTPIATINPLTPTGVGIQQNIGIGNPVAAGSGNAIGVGIQQQILIGTPVVTTPVQATIGVGIAQAVTLGVPVMDNIVHMLDMGIEQDIALGFPKIFSHRFLLITVSQAAGFIDLDTALQEAFGDGVTVDGTNNVIDPIQDYLKKLTPLQWHQTKVIFEDAAAAFLSACNLPGIMPVTDDTDSVTLATLGTSTGSLSFVDGILVGAINPT